MGLAATGALALVEGKAGGFGEVCAIPTAQIRSRTANNAANMTILDPDLEKAIRTPAAILCAGGARIQILQRRWKIGEREGACLLKLLVIYLIFC
jgi:hypothetical protein